MTEEKGEGMKPDITLDQVDELNIFLQGKGLPDGIELKPKKTIPKLTEDQAWSVIWFLQEHLRVLPDVYEKCDVCGDLYNSEEGGMYQEKKPYHRCEGCLY